MKYTERLKARELRKGGESVKQIAKMLGVSQGSVSLWVRDIDLTDEQIRELHERTRKVSTLGAELKSRLCRERRVKWKSIGSKRLETDRTFREVCLMYWCEGLKSGNSFRFSNADLEMMIFIWSWISVEVPLDKIRFYVQYYGDNGITRDEIKQYWIGNLPGLDQAVLNHFTDLSQRPEYRRKVKNKIGKLPYGTAHIMVHSVEVVQKVLGGIEAIKEEIWLHRLTGRG